MLCIYLFIFIYFFSLSIHLLIQSGFFIHPSFISYPSTPIYLLKFFLYTSPPVSPLLFHMDPTHTVPTFVLYTSYIRPVNLLYPFSLLHPFFIPSTCIPLTYILIYPSWISPGCILAACILRRP